MFILLILIICFEYTPIIELRICIFKIIENMHVLKACDLYIKKMSIFCRNYTLLYYNKVIFF